MIDWTKERATKNYCGFCNNRPTSGGCDGSCFTDKEKGKQNRVDHSLVMINSIPKQIEELNNRLQEFKDGLSA